jgi:hypothetical protein
MDSDSVRCSVCGEVHPRAEVEMGFRRPDPLLDFGEEERKARCKESDDLGSIDGERFFVRGVLPIPVQGRDLPYSWGVWAEVNKESFDRILALWSDENQASEPPLQGTLANEIPLFEGTLGLPLKIRLTGPTTRPAFHLDESPHPLWTEQRYGVDERRVDEYNHSF